MTNKLVKILMLLFISCSIVGCAYAQPATQNITVQHFYFLSPQGNLYPPPSQDADLFAEFNEKYGPFSDLYIQQDELSIYPIELAYVQQAKSGEWIPLPGYSEFEEAIPDGLAGQSNDEGFWLNLPEEYQAYGEKYTLYWVSNTTGTGWPLPYGDYTGADCWENGKLEAILCDISYKNPYKETNVEIPLCPIDLSACQTDDEKVRMMFESCPGRIFCDLGYENDPLGRRLVQFVTPVDFNEIEDPFIPPQTDRVILHDDGTVTTDYTGFTEIATWNAVKDVAASVYEKMILAINQTGQVLLEIQDGIDLTKTTNLDPTKIAELKQIKKAVLVCCAESDEVPIFLKEDGTLTHCQSDQAKIALPYGRYQDIESCGNLLYLVDENGTTILYKLSFNRPMKEYAFTFVAAYEEVYA